MAGIGCFFILLFILSQFDVFQSKANADTRPLTRSYDYWISVVGEIANHQNAEELLSFLDWQPLLPDPFKKDQYKSSQATWNRSQPSIFEDAAKKLNSYVAEWKKLLSGKCREDLLLASTALFNLGVAMIKQCEKENDETIDCVENQRKTIQKNLWIIQIINSFGAPKSGLFHEGQYLWYGSYHQCRYTNIPRNDNSTTPARYCMVSFGASAEEIIQPGEEETRLHLKWGTCIPDGCVKDQKSDLLNMIISSIFNTTRLLVTSKALQTISRFDTFCEPLNGQSLSGGQIAFLVVFCILLALIFVGTIVDYRSIKWALRSKVEKKLSSLYFEKMGLESDANDDRDVSIGIPSLCSIINSSSIDMESVVSYKSRESLKRNFRKRRWWMKILMAFSIRLNGRWLFQTRDHNERNSNSSKRITCLYGIKALTMIWVIVGHSYIFCSPHISNLLFVANVLPRNFFAQLLLNASLSVDTFFMISGLLTSYIWCLRMSACAPEKQRLDSLMKWFVFYTHRLVRLLPPYALVLGFVSTWFSRLGSGPQWDPKRIYGVQCEDGNVWWRHLLLVNNLLSTNASSLCLPWMWYVAADMQMYLVVPIFLSLLWKLPKIGVCAIVFVVVVSSVGRGVFIGVEKLPTNLILFLPNEHFNNDFRKYFEMIYEKPYFRCSPYFIGVLTGWYLAVHSVKLRLRKVNIVAKICAWFAVGALCLWPLFGIYPMYGMFFHEIYNGMYAATNRTLWSIGLAMIIVMCHSEHGGTWVNPILSWKKFWPASRLTYSVYLTHELVMLYILYTMTAPIEFDSHLTILALFLLFLAFVYPVAFFNFVLIEAPALAAERLMFRRKSKRKRPKAFDNTITDRHFLTKRWADVVANNVSNGNGNGNGNCNGNYGDCSGWGYLYTENPTEEEQKMSPKIFNLPSKWSSSSDSSSAEVMIHPEIKLGEVSHEAVLKNVLDDYRNIPLSFSDQIDTIPTSYSPNSAEIRLIKSANEDRKDEKCRSMNASIASANIEAMKVDKF